MAKTTEKSKKRCLCRLSVCAIVCNS